MIATLLMAVFRLIHTWRCLQMEYCRTCDARVISFYAPAICLDGLGIVILIANQYWGK